MERRFIWLMVNVCAIVALVLSSCGPRATPTPTTLAPAPTVLAPAATPSAPAATPSAPAAAPALENAIMVTLKKLDGTTMKKPVEKPKYGGTLSVNIAMGDPWDLKVVQAGTGSRVLAYEKLLFGDWSRGTAGTGEISWQLYEYMSMDHFMGALAESWEMPDDETIIYHIRRGVRWAQDEREASRLVNGREVTAEDVVFSLNYHFLSEPKTRLRMYFGGTENTDIRAKDKYTVVVKAPKRDMAQFLGFMSDMIPIVPPEVIQKYGNKLEWRQVVGTGAFMIKDHLTGSVTTWVKNPNYWGYDPVLGKDYPLPYVDTIKYLDITDQSTVSASLRTGKLDGTQTLDKDMAKNLVNTAPYLKTKVVNFGTGSNRIAMNMQNLKAPWQDIRVRRALMLAINHQEIIDTYFQGAADLQAFPLPGAPELYAMGWAIPLKELPREIQELYEYHPNKAKQLLDDAGYPSGFKTELMISSNSPEFLDFGSMLKEYWAKIGVELKLDIKDAGVFSSYASGRQPAMIHDSQWGTATIYTKFEPPPSTHNGGYIVDPNIQKLRLEMFDVLWDFEKRTPIMRELYEYSMSQVWYLTLPSKWIYKVYQPWLKNYDAEASVGYWGQPWPYVWLDIDLKKKLGY